MGRRSKLVAVCSRTHSDIQLPGSRFLGGVMNPLGSLMINKSQGKKSFCPLLCPLVSADNSGNELTETQLHRFT